jgi:hypothetical protein
LALRLYPKVSSTKLSIALMVPLFLEELTEAILESGVPSEEIASVIPAAKLAVPATLHASLMARLDRLGPAAKQTAQVGAAIGREFAYELLVAAAERPEDKLQVVLDHLVAAGLIYQRGAPPHGSYLFKHALIQEAAYSTLLRNPRQELHARIALALEGKFADAVENQPEVLANHFAEARRSDKAVVYWLKAGRRALQRSANVEAITHLRKGIAALASLPEGRDRDRHELGLQLDLGVALLATRGWNAVNGAYRRAGELAQRIGDERQRFQATWGLWIGSQSAGDYDAARAFNAELFRITERRDDPALLLQAHHSAWATALPKPKLIAVVEHTAQGLALYDPEKHRAHAFLYGGHDAGVCGHACAAFAQWLLGFPDQADKSARQTVTLGETLSHPPSLAHALFFTALYHYSSAIALQCFIAPTALFRLPTSMVSHFMAQVRVFSAGGHLSSAVRGGEGSSNCTVVLRLSPPSTPSCWQAFFPGCLHSALAESYGRTGNVKAGLAASEEALKAMADGAERFWKAGALSVRGDLLLAAGH